VDGAETEAEAEEGVNEEAVPLALVSGDVGEGTGEGYDGDRAHIAARKIFNNDSQGNKG